MTPVELSRTVLHAVRRAVDAGELDVAVPERAVVTEPGPGGCGDFATTIALQLARPAGQPPRRVAEILLPRLAESAGIRDVVVTGPGFLNISLDAQADPFTGLVREIRRKGARYGYGDALAGQVVALRVPYEVRAEVVADAVVRIVGTQGGRATVEHGEPVNLRPVPAPEDPAPLGPDAAHWALLHPAPHDRPRITADHLVQRESNPLFRVRYAHARIRSLSRNAARLGFTAEPGPLTVPIGTEPADSARPTASGTEPATAPHPTAPAPEAPIAPHAKAPTAPHPPANTPHVTPTTAPHPTPAPSPHLTPTPQDPTPVVRPLLTPLADHPRILAAAATHRAPDRLARHLVTVADAVLPLLPFVLPVGEEKPSAAHRARLALAEAAGTVLAGGLSLLGIDAPEHL
ncbi:ArgS-related anticodon-binding protein NrtL [Streptomyces sp. Caat 7-52]|uniref:ArgS-related anticodon-binding protein NrtL n=1 Tax=Streptomyces sp. Caat 7-52 TaxID=2949637 RepID=UPI0020358650|nr:DALR anticodon-binding domain-containing protein [Streptomyces sp. Caat 7-52]